MCSSDLRKCKNAKSYLVETGNILSIPWNGAKEEPRFEPDNLEGQSSDNHLKENPEVLSRLGRQAGSKKASALAATLHNTKWETRKR